MDIEVKRCPFCNAGPCFDGDVSEWQDDSRYIELKLKCVGCGLSLSETIGWRRARDMSIPDRYTELSEKLIQIWNTRVDTSETEQGWEPIDFAPIGREMFVVKAIDVNIGFSDNRTYTSDPYCVWQNKKGQFSRWPHPFAPTHYMKLPKDIK